MVFYLDGKQNIALNLKKAHIEKDSAKNKVLNRGKLRNRCFKKNTDDIYNADEIVTYYSATPDSSLC